jgi:hypothetical protein
MTAAQHTFTLTGRADESQSQSFIYLPFEVPAGTVRLDVRYAYSAAVSSDPLVFGGNTVDIGIFDPRGFDFMSDGFRGWSGSARSEFMIGTREATPGYRAGPIQPGTWHVCLGLYKVAPQGCEYTVEVALTIGEDSGTFAPLLRLNDEPRPPTRADGWYRGEIHCHTHHSDGDSTPLEIVRLAESLGLDFLAITDHNVLSHQAELAQINTPLILIPGVEVTTYRGHWNTWGDRGWIDFRTLEQESMAEAVSEARRRGYVISCNHPRPHGPNWVFTDVDDFDSIEVWNGPWEYYNATSLAYWESKLRAGLRPTAVGGSDCHFLHRDHPARLGHPTNWFYCPGEPSAEALLEALRRGHVSLSDSPDGPRLTLKAGGALMGEALARPDGGMLTVSVEVLRGRGCTLELVSDHGIVSSVQVTGDAAQPALTVDVTGCRYLRAQLVEPDGDAPPLVRALTNPIYLDEQRAS